MNKYQGTFKKDGDKKTLIVQAKNWDAGCKKLREEFDKLGLQDWLLKSVDIVIKPGVVKSIEAKPNRAQRRKAAHNAKVSKKS